MAARPPKKATKPEETLDAVVLVRVSPTEKEALARLAKTDNRSLSMWIRLALLERARALGENV
jgi:predicted HicB family RNase H-like nuclease